MALRRLAYFGIILWKKFTLHNMNRKVISELAELNSSANMFPGHGSCRENNHSMFNPFPDMICACLSSTWNDNFGLYQMASEEHKKLSQYLKDVHANLRVSAAKIGAEDAWILHSKNEEVLSTYAQYMKKLATTHWEENCDKVSSLASSRIKWSAGLCNDYFVNKHYIKYRERDIEISDKLNLVLNGVESFSEPLKLLDVGSCYNPFKGYNLFDVLAVDLCPANECVKKCDILKVNIGEETVIQDNIVKQLKRNSFDIITFCFLLEYIPSSELRITACENAYKLLKPEGLLIIITPDSKHVGANSKLMKNWQYTLACLGYTRIKYEKLTHMHCMGFRKALHKDVAVRWATIHKTPIMDFSINIPQDYLKLEHESDKKPDIKLCSHDFSELPYCYL